MPREAGGPHRGRARQSSASPRAVATSSAAARESTSLTTTRRRSGCRSHSARSAARPSARAADSGYGKDPCIRPPMRTGSTGFPWPTRRTRSIAAPTSSTVTDAAGTKMTMTASTAGVLEQMREDPLVQLGRRGAEHVDRVRSLASGGSAAARAARVSSDSWGQLEPGGITRVRAQDSQASRVGQDRDASTL